MLRHACEIEREGGRGKTREKRKREVRERRERRETVSFACSV